MPYFASGIYLSAFSNAMMTQVDEIGSDRIFQMSELEFYVKKKTKKIIKKKEAISIVADEACLMPPEGVFSKKQ